MKNTHKKQPEYLARKERQEDMRREGQKRDRARREENRRQERRQTETKQQQDQRRQERRQRDEQRRIERNKPLTPEEQQKKRNEKIDLAIKKSQRELARSIKRAPGDRPFIREQITNLEKDRHAPHGEKYDQKKVDRAMRLARKTERDSALRTAIDRTATADPKAKVEPARPAPRETLHDRGRGPNLSQYPMSSRYNQPAPWSPETARQRKAERREPTRDDREYADGRKAHAIEEKAETGKTYGLTYQDRPMSRFKKTPQGERDRLDREKYTIGLHIKDYMRETLGQKSRPVRLENLHDRPASERLQEVRQKLAENEKARHSKDPLEHRQRLEKAETRDNGRAAQLDRYNKYANQTQSDHEKIMAKIRETEVKIEIASMLRQQGFNENGQGKSTRALTPNGARQAQIAAAERVAAARKIAEQRFDQRMDAAIREKEQKANQSERGDDRAEYNKARVPAAPSPAKFEQKPASVISEESISKQAIEQGPMKDLMKQWKDRAAPPPGRAKDRATTAEQSKAVPPPDRATERATMAEPSKAVLPPGRAKDRTATAEPKPSRYPAREYGPAIPMSGNPTAAPKPEQAKEQDKPKMKWFRVPKQERGKTQEAEL